MNDTIQPISLAVIGAGPGGYPAAFYAADLGMKVTLIDSEPTPGGVCLHCGCIPSKTLLHVAQLLTDAREAANYGVVFGEPRIDLEKLLLWKQGIIRKLAGGLEQLCRQRKIAYVQGRAHFADAHTVVVQKSDGKEDRLAFDYAILATGSRPISIPEFLVGSCSLNSTSALELREIPKTLLVVGGGYIGLELGSVYAALGTQVSVVEMTSGLLPGADRDLVLFLARHLQKKFPSILLNTKVAEMRSAADGARVIFEGENQQRSEGTYEKVLVSVGRRPNSEKLGLENTRVQVDPRGFVTVDPQRRTAEPSIFAVGDITGQPMLAHKATHEGRVAVEAIAGQKTVFEPQAIPAVVFTDPEIAWCGLTETEAKLANRAVKVVRFPWAASGRAVTLSREDGLTKLIVDPSDGRVLGVGIAGPGAGELIAEAVLAIEMGATVSDLKLTIHPHPTLSETMMEAAEVFFGHSAHLYQRKKT